MRCCRRLAGVEHLREHVGEKQAYFWAQCVVECMVRSEINMAQQSARSEAGQGGDFLTLPRDFS